MNETTMAEGRKHIRWSGYIMTGAATLFLLTDAALHLLFMDVPQVTDTFNQLGLPLSLGATLGVLELVCLALYLHPKTAVLGAVLMTGYLGGAVATNLRVGNPLLSHTLFPVYFGILLWAGLYLRHPRLRTFIPFWKP